LPRWERKRSAEQNVQEVVETMPTITMHGDAPAKKSVNIRSSTLDQALLDNGSDGNEYDIKRFLGRPTVLSTGTWTSSQGPGQGVFNLNIPEAWTSQVVFGQKLSGFMGFRAKFIVKLQINTNRFQQGRLLMYFFPQNTEDNNRWNTCDISLMTQTQLPHVEFDASSDTEVVFEIPYVCDQLYYNTTNGGGRLGFLNCIVYSSLTTPSSELSAEYTCWGYFEDVTLVYPTISSATYIAQVGGSTVKSSTRNYNSVSAATQEQQVSHTGPVSGMLHRVTRISNILSEVPLLSSVAGTASWASAILANTASAFGFAKPTSVATVMPFVQRAGGDMCHVDGNDQGVSLSLLEDNHIDILPGFAGSDEDDLSMRKVLSTHAWIKSVSWLDTQVPLQSLLSIDIGPQAYTIVQSSTYNGITYNYTINTPRSYFANIFTYYRGSIGFRVKIVKTEFHSGRIQCTYAPGYSSLNPLTVTDANSTYLHREIFDIRYTNEFTFVCPWASTVPYKHVSIPYGQFGIQVINELRHPDTVAASVTLLIESFAADDFEFACPRPTTFRPAVNATSQSSNPPLYQAQGAIVEDQVTDENITNIEGAPGIGTSNMLMDGTTSARFCIGEKITSLRQLIKRHGMFFYSSTPQNNVMIRPWYLPCINIGSYTGINKLTPALYYVDYLAYVEACFAYSRGSVCVKAYNNDYDDTQVRFALFDDPQVSDNDDNHQPYSVDPTYLAYQGIVGLVAQPANVLPVSEIRVPYYHYKHCHRVGVETGLDTNYKHNKPRMMLFAKNDTSDVPVRFTRAAGEDFDMSYFLYAPVTVDVSQTVTGNPFSPGAVNDYW
jgi:hypothetical protein